MQLMQPVWKLCIHVPFNLLDGTYSELSVRLPVPCQACCAVADIYGPSESLIGDYLEERGSAQPPVQVMTKFCCFGGDMQRVNADTVREVHWQAYLPCNVTRIGVLWP